MNVIWKYPLNFNSSTDYTTISLPKGSKVTGVGFDSSKQLCIWVAVSREDSDLASEQFRIVGTGFEYDGLDWEPVGTVIDLPFVWHVLQFRSK